MSQSLSKVYIHATFSTKMRTPFLNAPGIREEMQAYLAAVLHAHDCPAVLVGGTADHVHALFMLSRSHAISDVIRECKRVSSKWVKRKGRAFTQFEWQSGYGAFSVSHSNVARVRAYIAGQDEHHRKMDFQEELRRLLRKHSIAFDERYLWD